MFDGFDGFEVDGLCPLVFGAAVDRQEVCARHLHLPGKVHRLPPPVVVDPDLDGHAQVGPTPLSGLSDQIVNKFGLVHETGADAFLLCVARTHVYGWGAARGKEKSWIILKVFDIFSSKLFFFRQKSLKAYVFAINWLFFPEETLAK